MKETSTRNTQKKLLTFVSRAERAFGRVARKLRAENQKLGLRAVVWPNRKRASARSTESIGIEQTESFADAISFIEAKMGGKKTEAHWSFSLKEAAVKAKDAPVPATSPKKS